MHVEFSHVNDLNTPIRFVQIIRAPKMSDCYEHRIHNITSQ